jgi:hypothetical protein
VDAWGGVALACAGVGAGLSGSIAGLASLISYPALLATGLSPISANVTNTVALVFSSAGSVGGSRRELVGQYRRATRLGVIAIAGSVLGGLLLLALPSGSFERVVPWLIGFGSLTILAPRPAPVAGEHTAAEDSLPTRLALFAIGVYAGYFGAAAGVLLLALLLRTTADSLPRCNALKNLVLGLANLLAALTFALLGPVNWIAVIPAAIGLFVGGRLGPIVVRHSPARALRVIIALAGVGLAVYLGVQAYD